MHNNNNTITLIIIIIIIIIITIITIQHAGILSHCGYIVQCSIIIIICMQYAITIIPNYYHAVVIYTHI